MIKILIFFLFNSFLMQSQSVIGKWKNIDDNDGEAKAIIEIYEKGEKIHGKVLEIFNPKDRHRVCVNCTGEDKNRPILGMVVINSLQKDDQEYNSGTILDPKSGKLYKCYITLESKNILKVRGYIGFSLFGRTQYWYRVKN